MAGERCRVLGSARHSGMDADASRVSIVGKVVVCTHAPPLWPHSRATLTCAAARRVRHLLNNSQQNYCPHSGVLSTACFFTCISLPSSTFLCLIFLPLSTFALVLCSGIPVLSQFASRTLWASLTLVSLYNQRTFKYCKIVHRKMDLKFWKQCRCNIGLTPRWPGSCATLKLTRG